MYLLIILHDVSSFNEYYRINNCVGEENRYLFLQLVFYAFLLSFTTLLLHIWNMYYAVPCQLCDMVKCTLFQIRAILSDPININHDNCFYIKLASMIYCYKNCKFFMHTPVIILINFKWSSSKDNHISCQS